MKKFFILGIGAGLIGFSIYNLDNMFNIILLILGIIILYYSCYKFFKNS